MASPWPIIRNRSIKDSLFHCGPDSTSGKTPTKVKGRNRRSPSGRGAQFCRTTLGIDDDRHVNRDRRAQSDGMVQLSNSRLAVRFQQGQRSHRQQQVDNGPRPYIDPVRWRPLIMSFCRFFELGDEVYSSRLAESDFMKCVARGGAIAIASLIRCAEIEIPPMQNYR